MLGSVVLVVATWIEPTWELAAATDIAFSCACLCVLVSILFMPLMGKRAFTSRYRNVAVYVGRYFRRSPGWVVIGHVAASMAGVALMIGSWVVVSPRSELVEVRGSYYIVNTWGVKESVSSQHFFLALSAARVWMPAGAIVFFLGLLLMFVCADRYFGARPDLWPPASSRRYSLRARMFDRRPKP